MTVPFTFSTRTGSIPLSELDNNFAQVITIGNVAMQLGNTVSTLSNLTLSNVTITNGSVGNVTFSGGNVTASTSNVVADSLIANTAIALLPNGSDGLVINAPSAGQGPLLTAYNSTRTARANFNVDATATLFANLAASTYFGMDANGHLISTLKTTAPTIATNSTMSFQLVSNTQLKILVKGSDGTTRSNTLTLA